MRVGLADALLEMEDVSLGYTEEPVLEGVQLRVDAGELVVIAGSSGCGKSTLLKGAIGLLPPLAGTVRLLGADLAGLDDDRLALLRSRVGLLFQGGMVLAILVSLAHAYPGDISQQVVTTIVLSVVVNELIAPSIASAVLDGRETE